MYLNLTSDLNQGIQKNPGTFSLIERETLVLFRQNLITAVIGTFYVEITRLRGLKALNC
jgi:hypothetical protein